MALFKVNADLVKERAKCTFDILELTHLVDGGKEETAKRKKIENMMLSVEEFKDKVPEDYMSTKEKYENAIRKSCAIANILKNELADEFMGQGAKFVTRTSMALIKDNSPFMVHLGMFVPTLLGQATPDQQSYWLPRALNMEIIGTYAQTELGHGTFLRGLETTATYDPDKQEFILHSPTLSAYKWWPGGLGHTVNYCIVLAQLYTKGQCQGIHPFIVQIRDEDTHMPLPGIKVGEIGPKLGFNTVNNGFLGFENYRIPRDAMLMKNSQILPDGTYVKSQNEKLTYGTMVLIRVNLVRDSSHFLAKAVTIATRYSAVRHQSQPKPDEPEPQILDYLTQQHKLFINIATSYALTFAGDWILETYKAVEVEIKKGNTEKLPELHALVCCLKAVSTADSAAGVEQCRLACGGHGYMLSSNLPLLYGLTTAACTYEGENTVMHLQTARFLVKSWDKVESQKPLTPTVSYLATALSNSQKKWNNTPEDIISGFQALAAGKLASSVASIKKRMSTGLSYEDAWALTTVQLVAASESHCRAVLVSSYWNQTQRIASQVSPSLGIILNQLAELYLVYWTLQKVGDLLLYTTLSGEDVKVMQKRYEELLTLIRPNAVSIVDAFDFRDELLCSTLGSYDGRVYERLMEEAMKSPLNAEPVNQSFHKYLKPFMQWKL